MVQVEWSLLCRFVQCNELNDAATKCSSNSDGGRNINIYIPKPCNAFDVYVNILEPITHIVI